MLGSVGCCERKTFRKCKISELLEKDLSCCQKQQRFLNLTTVQKAFKKHLTELQVIMETTAGTIRRRVTK